MNMFKKNRKGFTLIELIIVIAILAILAAIAIPTFMGIIESANNAVIQSNASNIANAYNAYNALNPNATLDGTVDTQAQIQTALTSEGLWPQGLDATKVTAAWTWLYFHDDVCEVVDPSASAAASPATT